MNLVSGKLDILGSERETPSKTESLAESVSGGNFLSAIQHVKPQELLCTQ